FRSRAVLPAPRRLARRRHGTVGLKRGPRTAYRTPRDLRRPLAERTLRRPLPARPQPARPGAGAPPDGEGAGDGPRDAGRPGAAARRVPHPGPDGRRPA